MINILCDVEASFDIIKPILICPDFDTIFILNDYQTSRFDETFDGYKTNIIRILSNGQTFNKLDRLVYGPAFTKSIGGVSEILYDIDYDERWELVFKFQGKIRRIIHYSTTSSQIWPEEINNIRYIIGYSWDDIIQSYRIYDFDDPILNTIDASLQRPYPNNGIQPNSKIRVDDEEQTRHHRTMIQTRTTLPFKWFQTGMNKTGMNNDEKFPNTIIIEDGIDDTDTHLIQIRNGVFIQNGQMITYPQLPKRTSGISVQRYVIISSFEGCWYSYNSPAFDRV